MNNQRQRVLEKRIFAKGETSIEEVFRRVSNFLGNDDKERADFYKVMSDNLFLPNSPTLVNAGVSGSSGQLDACFVLPVEDDMGSIFETIKNTALIHKTGGGTGFNFSRLREKGAPVGAHGGQASGPVSFMRAFDAATETIKQGGVRRGANMGVLNVEHPDIEEFITCKTSENAINNFNISVGMTDKFMRSILDPKPFKEHFDNAKLFNKIVEQAWLNGEPGLLFIDRINSEHKRHTGLKDLIEATNPCGEQPLLPYECCCLGSINLVETQGFTEDMWDRLVGICVKFLNRVLEKNIYPLPQNKEIAMKNRKIGLGVMGYADWLICNGLTYGSSDALRWTDAVASRLHKLARKYGDLYGNKCVTTVAPTGTLSIIAQCSSGIEPNFSWSQTISRVDEVFIENAPIIDKLNMNLASLPDWFVTASEICPKDHVRTQAAWQKNIDSAVSKTINLNKEATREDIKAAIVLAYKLGCKGITLYRDGSRDSQVISNSTQTKEEPKVFKRSKSLVGLTKRYKTGCGKLYVTVNKDEDDNVKEVFVNNGKGGGCPAQSEALTRVIAKSLQHGVPKGVLIDQLKGIRCMSCSGRSGVEALSCPDAIGRSLLGEIATECKSNLPDTEKYV
jgi:ribonucleoside-diphosphate reductase alpha chain